MAHLTLGIDTASWVSVGLADDTGPIARRTLDDPRAHVEQLMPLVMDLLSGAERSMSELTGIVVGMGPGPFTGLRVGIATAETLAWSLNVGIRHVCSLDVIAQAVLAQDEAGANPQGFVTALDARRKELYWARYSASGHRIEGPSVSGPDEVPELAIYGPGAGLFPELLAGRARTTDTVDAALAAACSMSQDVDERLPEVGAEPLYLRRPDASLPTKRKSTLVLPKKRNR